MMNACDNKRQSSGGLCMHGWRAVVAMAAISAFALSGCSSVSLTAPVESRMVSKSGPAPQKSAAAMNAPVPDGFYRVRKGDTLIGIALDHGIAWRDLASWNQIENANVIEADQLLRIKPPAPAAKTEIRPIAPAPSGAAKPASAPPATQTPPAAPTAPPAEPATAPSPSAPAAADGIALSWPSPGKVITPFSDPGYKGIAIAGNEGDAVLAAGDGRVVYSGSGLRGYGNLVIVKHDGDFLTAYAHNKSILVTEGQAVKRGQKIAELGKSDSDIPKLHFEVRRSGKPVDPMKYLAQR